MSWRHKKRLATYLLLGLALVQYVSCLPELIRIGGLFGDDEDASVENAFRYAVYRVNHERGLLENTRLHPDIQRLPTQDSFKASKRVCFQVGLNTASLFGPQSSTLANYVNSMCTSLQIPHIETRMEPVMDPPAAFSINIHPAAEQLARAYIDLVKYFDWKNMLIIFGNKDGLVKIQSMIRADSFIGNVNAVIRQADLTNLRAVLKEAKQMGWKQIIADLNVTESSALLKMALQEGMIDPYHHYILTNPNIETINMEDYRHNYVNLTGLRLVDPADSYVRQIMHDMEIYEIQTDLELLNRTGYLSIPYESALVFDSVFLFAKALEDLDRSTTLRPINVSCEENDPWSSGPSLYNYLNNVKTRGLTGDVRLQHGRRFDFKLDIMQLRPSGLEKIGTWEIGDGANFSSSKSYSSTAFGNRTVIVTTLLNKPVIVTTLLEEPYVKLKEIKGKNKKKVLEGNDRFEGFCVDLLEEVSRIVGFTYRIHVVEDGRYGSKRENGTWDGLVGELVDGKADIAVAALTINYVRERVIDFTKPFLNLGISIIFKIPAAEKPGLFSFLNPLAVEIWIYVIGAYLTISFVIFILARFSPYEWYDSHPCNDQPGDLVNDFGLANSFWFTVGTLMQQGSDINPRAVSTRIVGGTWWFFTLIIISSYTANLAAFLTVERMVSPINNAEDLASQTEISYGTLEGGSTMTFFKDSHLYTYKKMWNFMESKEPSVFMKSSDEGIKLVKEGNYAYLMESTAIDYRTQKDCDLMQVGGLLDSKGYGIGTPSESPLRDKLSMAILNLQEEGKIQILYNKWWKESSLCTKEDKKDSKALGVANVGGIFVCLLGGLVLAVTVACMEFAWKSKKNAREDKQSLCSEMAEELRFAVRCHGSSKKPRFKRRCSKCTQNKPHGSHCRVREDHVESPNGMIQLKEARKASSVQTSRELGYDYKPDYRTEFEGTYLRVDYSDTET